MTLQEIFAKVTGLETKITDLEAAKAEAATALKAEASARQTLEEKLVEAQSELSKIKAAAPPKEEDEEKEEASVTDAIKALENAITVLKGIAGQGGEDEESKSEDSADSSDDMEAKKEYSAKHFTKVLAIRQSQLARKQALVKKKTTPTANVEKLVIDTIAKLGIPQPLALNKDGKNPIRAEKPDGSKRARHLIRSGFNEQPSVMALNELLGRKSN